MLVETDEAGNLVEARLDSSGNLFAKMAALPNQFILLAGRDKYNNLNFSSLDSNSNYACPLTIVSLNWYSDEMPVVHEKVLNPLLYSNAPSDDTLQFVRSDQSFNIYNGCTGINAVQEPASAGHHFKLYPNPVQTQLNIYLTSPPNEVTTNVFDL
ncbi:MAG TPA: hypothetical protein PLD84_16540 [Chitinophagales bacterium]|nr:hypothetical protein [Chitinophagales bacterium]